MMINLKVRDFMSHQPITMNSSVLLAEAVSLFETSNHDSAVVIDDNKIVGQLSERDCLKTLISNSYYCEGAPDVSEFMKTEFSTVSEDDNIIDIAQKVVNNCSGFCDQTSFPVVHGEELVGIIGVTGLVEALNQHYKTCQAY